MQALREYIVVHLGNTDIIFYVVIFHLVVKFLFHVIFWSFLSRPVLKWVRGSFIFVVIPWKAWICFIMLITNQVEFWQIKLIPTETPILLGYGIWTIPTSLSELLAVQCELPPHEPPKQRKCWLLPTGTEYHCRDKPVWGTEIKQRASSPSCIFSICCVSYSEFLLICFQ